MPYIPKVGADKYNRVIANGRSALRKQQRMLEEIVTGGPNRSRLFQLIAAAALQSAKADTAFQSLADDFDLRDLEE